MSRHVNHRGWIVLTSIASADGALCIDLFEHPSGGFGFEHLRSDPEDGGRWTAVGGFAGIRHDSAHAAADAALVEVAWLATEPRAHAAWEVFRKNLQ